ncbi:MAG TPA: hypothetical protein VHZ99_13160 [Steroidobacteraceae bacterium]|nr:hypothetical protein [Steroidobacteraceae bacterium]
MEVNLRGPRFRTEMTPIGFRAEVPARRNLFVIVFLLIWLGGWGFGETGVSKQLQHPGPKTPVGFLSFWIVGWTIGGALAAATIVWELAGREVVIIDPQMLTLRVEALGIGHSRSFRATELKLLRVSPYVTSAFQNRRITFPPIFGTGYGPVAFDYGARTFRFASALGEAEARMLIDQMASHLPRTVE